MGRPNYTEEFKREAVRLVEVSGRGVNEIAEDLGIAGVIGRFVPDLTPDMNV